MFPALVQVLLQQVVAVDVLRLSGALHGLLIHFQTHRRYRVSSEAGRKSFDEYCAKKLQF